MPWFMLMMPRAVTVVGDLLNKKSNLNMFLILSPIIMYFGINSIQKKQKAYISIQA